MPEISDPSDPLFGRVIDGRYLITSRIAYGGMATVYLATDKRLQREVAVKIMHAHLAQDESFRSKFMQEALSSARLAHPNVVSIFDHGTDQHLSYLVMEYLPGITLRELLKDRGRLSSDEALDILQHILSGLSAAHRSGIVHRDLKPENILLVDDGRIKIADFGLARAAGNHTNASDALVGTVAYLSPELVTRGIADARSDIYAIGIILYEMLVGTQPYTGEQPVQVAMQHLNGTVPPPSQSSPNIPSQLDDLVTWATSREAQDRPRDASELLDQVRRVVADETPQTTSPRTTLLPELAEQQSSTAVLDAPAGIEHLTGVTTVFDARGDSQADSGLGPTSSKLAKKSRSAKRRGVFGLIFLLLIALGAGGAGWYFGSGPGAAFGVPDVSGLTLEQAEAELTARELVPTAAEEHSLDIPVDTVIRTDPPSGSNVHVGDQVTVVISLGPRSIAMPELAGLDRDEAELLISESGFVLGEITELYSDETNNGIVMRATDGEGDTVTEGDERLEGSQVNLTVSLGDIADVTGLTLDDARQRLADLDLEVTLAEEKFSDSVESGKVLSQSADLPMPKGSTVTLVVSKGPEMIEVPDVSGMEIAEAKALLEDRGFEVSVPIAEVLWPAAEVTHTDPAAGSSVRKTGAQVTLRIRLAL